MPHVWERSIEVPAVFQMPNRDYSGGGSQNLALKKESMRTQLTCRNVKRKAVLASLLAAGLRGLCSDEHVNGVDVTAEHRSQSGPPFRVWGTLSVAGPDLKAEGRGETLDAAVLLVIRTLERELRRRLNRQELNRHNRLQTPKATRDRFLRVQVGMPHVRCAAAFRRSERLKYVMGSATLG